MEGLILFIIFILVSNSLASKNKKRTQQPPPSREQVEEMLETWLDEADEEMLETWLDEAEDAPPEPQTSRRRPSRNSRGAGSRRQQTVVSRSHTSIERECDYCTGEVVPQRTLISHSAATVNREATYPQVDVSGLQKKLGLSDLQNVLMWQEILAKPRSLKRR